jgi:tetratricopeptide (TPR) repeat protein
LQAEGEFALVMEKLEPALQLSGQPVKRGTMAHRHVVYMMLAESAAQLDDAPALRRYASQLESLAAQDGHRPYQAIAHRAWGIACRLEGEYADAETRLSQALELFEELGTPWQLGRTLSEMAELDLARSDPAAARDHFSRALSQFEAMQATPDVERTRAALAALG